MSTFQIKQLTKATESQIKDIADFFSDAFHGDVSMKAFVGGDWGLLPELETAMLRASLLEGVVYVVTVGKGSDEKIVSAGYWFGDGSAMFGSEKQRALGYDAWFEKISDETKIWMSKTYPEEITALDESHYTKEEIAKRWWCYHIATRPGHEGKGYATAIIDTMFRRAQDEGTFIGLATAPEVNVKKYLSMGFEARGPGGLLHSPTGDFWHQLFILGYNVSSKHISFQ